MFKATTTDTAGQLAVMESTYPAGLAVPAHAHGGEDEMFYLLDGWIVGFCSVFVPRDRPHGLTVLDNRPTTTLVMAGPPRLDSQIAEAAGGGANPADPPGGLPA